MAPDELALIESLIASSAPSGALPPTHLGPMPPPARRLLERVERANPGLDDHDGSRAEAIVRAALVGSDPEAYAAMADAVRAERASRA